MRALRARLHPADGREQDSGMSIMELLVSMGILLVVLSTFMAGVVVMTKNTVRAQVVAESGAEIRRVFQRFDKQVRYADAINLPGSGTGGTRYVEFRTPASVSATGVTMCTQWRWDPATKLVQTRTWQEVVAVLPGWTTMASNVVADASVPGYPFTVAAATPTHPHQELTVSLLAESVQDRSVSTASSFVARNSSVQSNGNADINGDGASDNPACWRTGVRP